MTGNPVRLLRTPVTAIAVLLIAVTVASWLLGGVADRTTGALLLVAAMVKVSLVGRYFMELAEAPLGLRLGFDGWCAGVGALMVAMYLMA